MSPATNKRARLHLKLLGGFETRLASGATVTLPTRKAQALFAYLAVRPGQAYARDKLAALLWADRGDAQARDSLRHTLVELRKAFPDRVPSLSADARAVALDPAVVEVDVVRFERLVTAASAEDLAQAAEVYEGDFLDGFVLREPAFEEWLVAERERLRELAFGALRRLLEHQAKARASEPAIRTALRLLALDATQEVAHRALMRLYARQGRRGAALRQYQTCLAVFRRELGAEPETATRTLYLELLQRAPDRPHPAPRGGRETLPSELAVTDTPLVGRTVELERLERLHDDTWAGTGGLVIVSGEAGIGKSRLVAEVVTRKRARGGRLLFGRAYQGEQLPFGPWVDALRTSGLVDEAVRDGLVGKPWDLELARLFPEFGAARIGLPRSEDYVRLFEAVAELLRAAVARGPLLVVLEDLQWSDELSIRLLAFLRRRLGDAPVLVLGTVREEDLDPRHPLRSVLSETEAERIHLTGLTETDTMALVQAAGRAGQDPSLVVRLGEQVWRTSAGNPFVVVETMRAIEAGEIAGSGALALPRRVKEITAARLERLSERAVTILAVAAVMGRAFDFALLEAASGRGGLETAEAVEELVRRRILHVVGERVDFTHDRVLQVAYERIVPTTRKVLHRAAGVALEDLYRDRLDEVADQLGFHFSRAGEARKALRFLFRFAELAAQRYALDDALGALRQARAVVDTLVPGERDQAALDAALRQAFVLSLLGRQREVSEVLRSHAAHVERVDDVALVAEYHFRDGMTHFYLGEQVEAYAAAERALAHGERSGDPERIGKALHVLSLSSFAFGKPRRGIAHATRATSFLNRPHTQHWLGLVQHDLGLNSVVAGDLHAAVEASERGGAIGVAAGDARLIAQAGYISAWARVLLGEYDLAVETARQAREASRDPIAFNLTSGTLGHAHLERGDAASAIPLLRGAVEQLNRIPVQSAATRNMALLSEAYLLTGDLARARDTAREALASGGAAGGLFNIGQAERALGRIALVERDFAVAEQHLSRALAAFEGCEATFEVGRTHLHMAELRAGQGDRPTARDHVSAARTIFEAAHAPARITVADELARTLGITDVPDW